MTDVNISKSDLVGTIVTDVTIGVGSFFNIYSHDGNGNTFQLWIYDTKWAITDGDIEFNSSDYVTTENFIKIKSSLIGKKYTQLLVIDEYEIHMLFENIALEMWIDEKPSMDSVDLAYIYYNRGYASKISTPLS